MEPTDATDEAPIDVPAPMEPMYCAICSIPVEYCMFGVSKEKCKRWLLQEHPAAFALHYPAEAAAEATAAAAAAGEPAAADGLEGLSLEDEERKHQSRGGKALQRDVSTKADKEAAKRAKAKVTISIAERNRRKAITNIKGLEAFGLDLKKVAKRLAGKYACGCSVVKMPAGHEEVALQGDFVDDLVDFLPTEYPEVAAKQIAVNVK